MPLNHYDLPSVFARGVELGLVIVDGSDARGLRDARERLRQTLTPNCEVSDDDRLLAIARADCSPQAMIALRCVHDAVRDYRPERDLDRLRFYLGIALCRLRECRPAPDRARVEHLRGDFLRLWPDAEQACA
jgi:hypothetical protein